MKPTAPVGRHVPSPAVLALYDAVPNVLWSVLGFAPVVAFCCQHLAQPWLYGFGAASLLAYAWPVAWLRRLQLSAGEVAYRRLGVPGLNRFTQRGSLLNGLVRRRYPHYRALAGRAALAKLWRTTYQQERFHWAALLFSLFVSGYAVGGGWLGWALLLTLANVGYNLYPIWLQQYVRLRLRRALPDAPRRAA